MTSAKPTRAEIIVALLKTHAGVDLRLRAWDGSEAGPEKAPVVVIRSPRALQRILWRPGELGLARAYISGDLDFEGDLTDGLRHVWGALRDTPKRGIALAPAAWAAARAAAQLKILSPPPEPPGCELRVRGRRHSRARDQAVIAGHYDLPAAFYQLILDPSMAYSCAYWSPGHHTLADAQRAKLELIGGKLGLEPGQRLLDMGCGWGSLTIHAARARVQVTGVTLSREQGGYVRQRARGLGLGDRAEVRIQDYRDPLDDRYDAVASVEMGEHVGAAQYPRFLAALHDRLRPDGRLLIQQMSRGARAPGGAGSVQGRPKDPSGHDHGPRPVAVHSPPQLLRRLLHVVGPVPDQLRLLGRTADHSRAAADDLPADPRFGPAAHRTADGRPPQVRRLRRADQRLLPAPPQTPPPYQPPTRAKPGSPRDPMNVAF